MPLASGSPPRWLYQLEIAVWGTAALLLGAPLIAMSFTSEVRWSPFDFALFAVLIGAVLVPFGLALRRGRNLAALAGIMLALVPGFAQIWITLAVGLIGAESDSANLPFVALPLMVMIAALYATIRPQKMTLAITAVAAAQLLLLARMLALEADPAIWLAAVCAGLWLIGAWLLRRAAQLAPWPARQS